MSTLNRFENEFNFTKKCLDFHKIAYNTYSVTHPVMPLEDLGIRHALGFEPKHLKNIQKIFLKTIKPSTISYVTDELRCHYITFLLPEPEQEHVFVIGPYITIDEREELITLLHHPSLPAPWLDILKNYYFQISSFTNEESLNALILTLADLFWGKDNYSTQYLTSGLPENLSATSIPDASHNSLLLFSNIELIETLYSSENELANAIMHGRSSQARAIFSNLPVNGFKQGLEPVRNLKNFSIVSNTLFRKAAEQGGVHPIYVDQLSNSFLTRIEEMTRSDNVFELWAEMIQRYCALVNTYNTRSYSLPIQKAISRINFDITADLSLKTTASYLKVNASYLSTLFKKETGYTLTNYVNKKRMEHAAFLLSTTAQSVSSIAQQCGILDENYFTKLFKRHYQVTPSQYRENIEHGPH